VKSVEISGTIERLMIAKLVPETLIQEPQSDKLLPHAMIDRDHLVVDMNHDSHIIHDPLICNMVDLSRTFHNDLKAKDRIDPMANLRRLLGLELAPLCRGLELVRLHMSTLKYLLNRIDQRRLDLLLVTLEIIRTPSRLQPVLLRIL